MVQRSGLPKYCSWAFDRHGKKRVRFRKDGVSTYLSGVPYSEDFMRAYYSALEGVKMKREKIGAERTRPGSLDALCVLYYKTDCKNLKPTTRQSRRSYIEQLRDEYGTYPIRLLKI